MKNDGNDTQSLISYCGLICSSCIIYLAAREQDKIKKEKMIYEIIRGCKEYYGVDYQYEDINDCDGCKSDTGRLFFTCSNCKIRNCALGKGIENCAFCEDYACNELNELFKTDPGAKSRLDNIRKNFIED